MSCPLKGTALILGLYKKYPKDLQHGIIHACMCICISIFLYIYLCIYIYIYMTYTWTPKPCKVTGVGLFWVALGNDFECTVAVQVPEIMLTDPRGFELIYSLGAFRFSEDACVRRGGRQALSRAFREDLLHIYVLRHVVRCRMPLCLELRLTAHGALKEVLCQGAFGPRKHTWLAGLSVCARWKWGLKRSMRVSKNQGP